MNGRLLSVIIFIVYATHTAKWIQGMTINSRPEMDHGLNLLESDEIESVSEVGDLPEFLSKEQADSKTVSDSDGAASKNILGEKWLDLDKIPPSKLPVRLHSNIILECQAVGSPPPTAYWLKNGKRVENMDLSDSSESVNQIQEEFVEGRSKAGFVMAKVVAKLVLQCLRPEDEAEYVCVAYNDGHKVSASTEVIIQEDDPTGEMTPECELRFASFLFNRNGKPEKPAYISSAEALHMECIGADVILPCRGAGHPVPKITWTDGEGQRILPGDKFQVNGNGSLKIRNLSWSEMGEYNCVAENPSGKDSMSTFLYPLMVHAGPYKRHNLLHQS